MAFADRVGRGHGVRGRVTVGELLERWFALASLSWAPTTIRQTRSAAVVDRHLRPHIGEVLVGELTTADIDALNARLLTGSGEAKGLSGGTVQRVHVVLRSASAQAVRWEWIWDNPAAHAVRIVAPNREPDPPSVDELVVLLDHLETRDPALHAFVVVAVMTGARRAHLLGLRWRNINFDLATVSFTAAWIDGPNGPVLTETKTRRHHLVELGSHTAAVLAAHRRRCESPRRDCFVFSSQADGTRAWRPNLVTKAFGRAVAEAGYGRSVFMTCVTSWRPRCSSSACPSLPSLAVSTTVGPLPPSSTTPAPPQGATRPQPKPAAKSSTTPASKHGPGTSPEIITL